jgi:spore maturation protein CgeB
MRPWRAERASRRRREGAAAQSRCNGQRHVSESGALAGERVLLVGIHGDTHVGSHLDRAARDLGLDVAFCESTQAYAGPAWRLKLNWWLRGHRPPRLGEFSEHVVRVCRQFRPSWMLATGLAPLDTRALGAIATLGVQRLNFLTDDPWNPAHRAPWFMRALPHYDHVYTPRRANVEDLQRIGCPSVTYLPFAYAPEVHYADPPASPEERARFASDVVFAGAADRDRVPYLSALARAGFQVGLYGKYWRRFPQTWKLSRGQADPQTLRKAVGGANVALCLVRRANRDGHAMRSFEVPAIGACMLAEDTAEHRELFGADREAVVYFHSIGEMVDKTRWLVEQEQERRRLAQAAHRLISGGQHTYKDRLELMLARARKGR